MRSLQLTEFGFPNVVLYEDGSAYDTVRNTYLGNPTDSVIFVKDPNGATKRFTRNKLVGECFRAPWRNGLDYANLGIIDCSNYFATPDGRIFGKRNMDYIEPHLTHDGYLTVGLYTDSGDYQPWRVQRVIATAFLDNPQNKDTVDHADNDRTNNRVGNLRWMWMWENDEYRRRTAENGISDDKIREICKYLESGMSQTEAAKAAGVKRHTVKDLQYGSYYRITKDFNIPRYEKQKRAPVEFRKGTVGNHGQDRRKHVIVRNEFGSTTIP